MATRRWINRLTGQARNTSANSVTATEQCVRMMFESFDSMVTEFNSTVSDLELKITPVCPYRAAPEKNSTVLTRAGLFNKHWTLSIVGGAGLVKVFLVQTNDPIQSVLSENSETERFCINARLSEDGVLVLKSVDTGAQINSQDLNALILASFNDLIKRSQPEAARTFPEIRLVVGEHSLNSAFKRLLASNHRLSEDLLEQNEQIRNEIMMEIHDDILSDLMLLKLSLTDSSQVELLANAVKRLRKLCSELTSRDIADWGLEVALIELVPRLSEHSGISMIINGKGLRKLPQKVALQIYRIVQESLNNAIKHSSATEIAVDITVSPESMQIRVADNGSGMQERNEERPGPTGKGLRIIQERLKVINQTVPAELVLDSRPGKGTSVILTVYDGKC